METQGRTFAYVNIYSSSINHWASQVGAQASDTLKYAFLGDSEILPEIISSHLDKDQEAKLLDVLSEHKEALGWTIADIKGVSPSVVIHHIHLEEDAKTIETFKPHFERGGESGGHEIARRGYHLPYLR